MLIERYEKIFMILGGVFLAGAVVALAVSVVGGHATLPAPAGRIEPSEVTSTAPFDEPGVFETEDGVEVVMIARAWQWEPAEVTVPAGEEVTFTVTSADVIHGMLVPETQINAMVIPGQITEVTQTFSDAGTYSVICHEYCGIGHHTMGGRIIVEES